MKRLFCTVILTLCMGCLSAQSNRLEMPTETHEDERFVLDSSFRQEINYEYHATDSIYLSRGFFRHANLSYPHAYDYMKTDDYEFYLDLRRYGSVRHSGFGLGFERAVMYITGMENIRDVLPFPRTTGNCEL